MAATDFSSSHDSSTDILTPAERDREREREVRECVCVCQPELHSTLSQCSCHCVTSLPQLLQPAPHRSGRGERRSGGEGGRG